MNRTEIENMLDNLVSEFNGKKSTIEADRYIKEIALSKYEGNIIDVLPKMYNDVETYFKTKIGIKNITEEEIEKGLNAVMPLLSEKEQSIIQASSALVDRLIAIQNAEHKKLRQKLNDIIKWHLV